MQQTMAITFFILSVSLLPAVYETRFAHIITSFKEAQFKKQKYFKHFSTETQYEFTRNN
jgi:hypothetical protein